jgi:hypothetical protein
MDTAAAATRRAQSKEKAEQEKSEHEGGPLRIRGSDSPWNRDLCGSEVYYPFKRETNVVY